MMDSVLDMSDVSDESSELADLRELNRLMSQRFMPDMQARAALIPVLRRFAGQSRQLHRLVSGLRAREIDRFDAALETVSAETGINTEFLDVDASPQLARIWSQLDELDDGELTLIGRAESAELLAAFLADSTSTKLTVAEECALNQRRLYALRVEACRNLADAMQAYKRARLQLVGKEDDPDPVVEANLLDDLLGFANAIHSLRERIADIDEQLERSHISLQKEEER